MLETLEIKPGALVRCGGRRFKITHLLGLEQVLLVDIENGQRERLDISVLEPDDGSPLPSRETDLTLVPDEDWNTALERLEVLRPLLEPGNTMTVDARATETGIHRATIYRWLKKFNDTGLTISLRPTVQDGGRGLGRLSPEVEKIVQETIKDYYLNDQKHGIQDTWLEVKTLCRKADLPIPAVNTVRNRILVISEEQRMRSREGRKQAEETFVPSLGAV